MYGRGPWDLLYLLFAVVIFIVLVKLLVGAL